MTRRPHVAIIRRVRTRSLRAFVSPLILIVWLGTLWACMAPQSHHASHNGPACASVHNAIGPQAAGKLAGAPAALPMMVAVFLAIATLLIGFARPTTDAPPLLERRRHRSAQPNAPPILTFVS